MSESTKSRIIVGLVLLIAVVSTICFTWAGAQVSPELAAVVFAFCFMCWGGVLIAVIDEFG